MTEGLKHGWVLLSGPQEDGVLWVASNLSQVADTPVLALAHKVVRRVADRLANDITKVRPPRCTASANRYRRAVMSA